MDENQKRTILKTLPFIVETILYEVIEGFSQPWENPEEFLEAVIKDALEMAQADVDDEQGKGGL